MKVFRLLGDPDHYESLMAPASHDFRLNFHGKSLKQVWKPLEVEQCSNPDEPPRPPSDFPTLVSVPVFSTRAVDAIGETLCHYGEFLPIVYKGVEYYAFNVTNIVDALNVSESELFYIEDGVVFEVMSHVFRPEVIADQLIFKLPQITHRNEYVTERFVDLVTQHGLTGFSFWKVWEG